MNGCVPDATFILMVDVETGMERIAKNRSDKMDRMDLEKKELHQKVYDGYKFLLEKDTTKRLVEIDASKTMNEVIKNVYEKIKTMLN
jgi:dTMP kinase